MELSKRIVSIRESKGMTQSDVAEILNTDRQNYSRLEKRGDKLSIEQVKAIATALDVPLNELLGLDAPVVNQEKVKELEERIKDKQTIISSYESDFKILSESLGGEIVKFFSAANSGGSISQLYKPQDEMPYCKLIRSDNTKRQIESYLNFKCRESEFLRSFYTSELFDMEVLFEAMDSYDFIVTNKENISTMVHFLIERDWEEWAEEEQERIADDPRTQKRNEET